MSDLAVRQETLDGTRVEHSVRAIDDNYANQPHKMHHSDNILERVLLNHQQAPTEQVVTSDLGVGTVAPERQASHPAIPLGIVCRYI